jgi:hypothetical protein
LKTFVLYLEIKLLVIEQPCQHAHRRGKTRSPPVTATHPPCTTRCVRSSAHTTFASPRARRRTQEKEAERAALEAETEAEMKKLKSTPNLTLAQDRCLSTPPSPPSPSHHHSPLISLTLPCVSHSNPWHPSPLLQPCSLCYCHTTLVRSPCHHFIAFTPFHSKSLGHNLAQPQPTHHGVCPLSLFPPPAALYRACATSPRGALRT